jgi:hypothetical protein
MIHNNKPDIATRQTIEHCLSRVEDMEFARQLSLRLSLIGGDESHVPKPVKTVDGTEVYLRLKGSCPYKNCPNAVAAMTLRGPRVGEVMALCANPRVASAYVAMTSLNPAEAEYQV